MKSSRFILFLGLFLLAAQPAYAAVDFDGFGMHIIDDDIDVGDSFELSMVFEDPDDTDNVDVELEIKVGAVTVFLDEDYAISFVAGEDKVINISSDDFPGPDLDHDFFTDNLMNYLCGDFTVTVYVSGSDIEDELEEDDRLTIGEDDEKLSFSFEPENPIISDDITFTVLDKDDDEFRNAKVKVTWIDDPDGDLEEKWDSDDAYWDDESDRDGEVELNVEDEFGDEAAGSFQVDVYADGYCLKRGTMDLSEKQLTMDIDPASVTLGESALVCVTDPDGDPVFSASVYVYGPGYSKTYNTLSNGCIQLTLSTVGQFKISASKQGYASSLDNSLIVEEKISTTTTKATTTTSSTTTRATTTTTQKKALERIYLSIEKQTFEVGEQVEVYVTDQKQKPVANLELTVSPSGVKGRTDEDGFFTFSLDGAGAYRIESSFESETYYPLSEGIDVVESGDEERPAGSSNLMLYALIAVALSVLLIVIVSMALVMRKSMSQKKKEKPKEPEKEETHDSFLSFRE